METTLELASSAEAGVESDADGDATRVVPRIDRNRCEGDATCVRVCPFEVLEVRDLSSEERRGLKLLTRVRVALSGGKQAFAVRPEDCYACGECVQLCPEKAISLERAQ